ncbi:hypothetical protein [Roseiconus lacunae]|uniref:WYL domain-containing protein n=1 Tax=Roseiconus lacunae TaxID=2605694 RepID=A0ABT7PH65_9BACT|nr:hypothetical protein [Roseiconus lacunae]MDM4015581.1 hypothetical protein [Roseiconus lacunae]
MEFRLNPVPFYVAATNRRWFNAARRFVGAFAHAAADDPTAQTTMTCDVRAVDASYVRSAIATANQTANHANGQGFVLWEMNAANSSAVSLSIAQVAVSHHDVLQFVAIDRSAGAPPAATPPVGTWSYQLRLMIQELGVAMIADRPEDLVQVARIVQQRLLLSHDKKVLPLSQSERITSPSAPKVP